MRIKRCNGKNSIFLLVRKIIINCVLQFLHVDIYWLTFGFLSLNILYANYRYEYYKTNLLRE